MISAALALLIAGLAWAEAPGQAEDGGALLPLRLAQADSQSEAEAEPDLGDAEEPEFTDEVMQHPELIATGEAIWREHCALCHGRDAYPGKGPNLRPSRYDAEFVYLRVTYGFGQMPAWEDVFTHEERMAVTAYVLSDAFSP